MAMLYRPNGYIPDRIMCNGCGKLKPQGNYASNRLDKLRRTGGIGPNTFIMCIPCNGGDAPTELKCYQCDKVKVITAFAKAQRAKDEPECQECTVDRLAVEPGRSESDHRSDDSDAENSPWENDIDAPLEPVTLPGMSARSLAQGGGVSLPGIGPSSKPSTTNTHQRIGASTVAGAPSASSAASVTSRTSKTTGRSIWKETKPPKGALPAEQPKKRVVQPDFAARQFDESDSDG